MIAEFIKIQLELFCTFYDAIIPIIPLFVCFSSSEGSNFKAKIVESKLKAYLKHVLLSNLNGLLIIETDEY